MAAPTNPFAAALEGQHRDDAEQQPAPYNPHNPFATTASPAAPPTSAFHNHPSANNPFAQTEGFNNTPSAPYTIPDQQPPPSDQFGSNRFESANEISQQLSGLDFAEQPATNSSARQQQEHLPSAAPAFPQTNTAALDTPPSTFQAQETQPSAMTATYAPPPGPPPGHFEGYSSYAPPSQQQQQQQQDFYPPTNQQTYTSPPQQSAPVNGTPSNQTDADEAFARQLLAEDEARVMQGRRGRQHSSTTRAAAIPAATPPRPRDPNEEKQWNTKEIYWQGRLQRIIIQNENGPCSLIALCNVLLLRGTLQITPEDRPAVSYSYLSSLLGEHLIDVISTSGSDTAMDLEAALSILPQTQYGLDVNVCFASIYGFSVDEGQTQSAGSASLIDMSGDASGSSIAPPALPNAEKQKQRGELALFKLCKVPLVHGWLADEDDKETWGAVVERSGDYDKALDRVVAGDEVAKGSVVESQGAASSAFATDSLPSHEALLVKDAILIRNFLESTATQLTYPGLYALSTKLDRGVPYALFRNSHISVLYRPSEEELQRAAESMDSASSAAQPQLYQLVTDSTLENEDAIVWESVEDVDGSASRFYDGKFRQATPSQDFLNNQETGQTGEDADFAYAQQLQDQESQRARRHQRQQQQQAGNRRLNHNYYAPPPGGSRTGGGGGGGGGMSIISRMLAGRKSNKQKNLGADARNNSYQNSANAGAASGTQTPTDDQQYSRMVEDNRRTDRQQVLSNSDRTNFYPMTNDISGLTLPNNPRPNQGSDQGNVETAPGQEYNTAKKDKWYKKIF